MPSFVGLRNPTFDEQKLGKLVESNAGCEMSTEEILKGIEAVRPLFSDELAALIKESGLYVVERADP